MDRSDLMTLKAVLLYILENGGDKIRRNVYYIVKVAYCAQQKHLSKWLCPIFNDKIVALQFGPVPSSIYDALKMARGDQKTIIYHESDGLKEVAEAISFDEEVFLPKETVDMDWLSKSNIDCLKEAIAEVSAMSFEQILQASHGKEWQRAYDSDRVMDYLEIAKEGGLEGQELDYLKESLELDALLK